jgi:hypothetical protein
LLARRATALAVPLLILAFSTPALACTACGCGDPSVSQIGVPDTMAGNGVAGISTESKSERQITVSRQQTVSAMLFWQPNGASRVWVKAPFVDRAEGGRSRAAPGDLQLGGALEIEHDGGLSRGQSLALTAELAFPTGTSDGAADDLATGTGATRAGLGLAWYGHWHAWRGYASAIGYRSTERRDGSQPGDAWLANAGIEGPATKNLVDFTAELNFRDVRPDHWPLGTPVAATGGDTLYLTPGVISSLGPDSRWFARASVQVPIAWSVYGDQRPGPVLQAGLFTRF